MTRQYYLERSLFFTFNLFVSFRRDAFKKNVEIAGSFWLRLKDSTEKGAEERTFRIHLPAEQRKGSDDPKAG
jgi:hypothetical protein